MISRTLQPFLLLSSFQRTLYIIYLIGTCQTKSMDAIFLAYIYYKENIFFCDASKQNNVNGTVFIHNAKYLCLHYINKDIAFHKIQENLQLTNEYQYYNIRELISVIIRFYIDSAYYSTNYGC